KPFACAVFVTEKNLDEAHARVAPRDQPLCSVGHLQGLHLFGEFYDPVAEDFGLETNASRCALLAESTQILHQRAPDTLVLGITFKQPHVRLASVMIQACRLF